MNSARRRLIAITTLIVLVVVGLAGVFAAGASAGTLVRPQNVVAPIGIAGGQVVGAHQPVLPGQRRVRAPDYDRMAVGSSVAAESGGGALSDAAESCSANSFTGSTPVLLASGKEIPISKVKVGDEVLATDPQTGKTAARPVTGIIVHSGEHTMVDVTLVDGSELTATDHHPFWDATTDQFTYAIDLRVGDRVLESDGQLLIVTSVRSYGEDVTAYNLTVDGIHTYFVGTTPVLVHNSCSISMDEAVGRGASHVGGRGEMIATPRGNFQFIGGEFTNPAGDLQRNIARFDIQNLRPDEVPHLNLEVQINKVPQPSLDPHTWIDPFTVRPGDVP